MLTTSGRAVLARLLIPGHGLHLGIGVGHGTTPETEEDGVLEGDGDATSAWYQPLDVGFPHFEGGVVHVQASFGMAKFHWREFGLIAASAPIIPHHTLVATAHDTVLVSRAAPAVPLHHSPKDGSQVWAMRIRLHLG